MPSGAANALQRRWQAEVLIQEEGHANGVSREAGHHGEGLSVHRAQHCVLSQQWLCAIAHAEALPVSPAGICRRQGNVPCRAVSHLGGYGAAALEEYRVSL